MKTRTVTSRAAVLGTALAAVAALTTMPAQAATGYNRCPADRLCVFTGLNGSGTIGIFRVGDANLGAAPGPSGLNNNIESVWNRSPHHWIFYPDANYRGAEGLDGLVPRTGKDNLIRSSRNKTSSLKIF